MKNATKQQKKEINKLKEIIDNPHSDKKLSEEKQSELYTIKKKIRKEKKKNDELQKIEKIKKSIVEPFIKGNLIKWVDKDDKNRLYEGFYKDKLIFEIKRGIISFSLKIKNDKILKEHKNSHSSTDIFKLQKKANEILLAFHKTFS